VLRRTSTKVGMNPSEVESALERKVNFELPSDGAVPLSVNRGHPLVLSEPKADFSRAVRDVAKAVSTPVASRKPKRRLFALGNRS